MVGGSDGAVGLLRLSVDTIEVDLVLLAKVDVLVKVEGREAPLLRDKDVLATRELELGTAESLESLSLELILGADREEDLVNVHAGDETFGLTVGTTHTSLETIGTGAGKHTVDTNNVVGVNTDTKVESLLTSELDHVTVDNDTGSFEGVGGDLLELTRDEVDAHGEGVGVLGTRTDIVDADLGLLDSMTKIVGISEQRNIG